MGSRGTVGRDEDMRGSDDVGEGQVWARMGWVYLVVRAAHEDPNDTAVVVRIEVPPSFEAFRGTRTLFDRIQRIHGSWERIA